MPRPDADRLGTSDAGRMSKSQTHLPALTHVRVRDCMHSGVLTCATDDSLRHVAAIMANHRVHAVVMTSGNADRPQGVVSDLDVLTAVASGADCTAQQVAATEPLTVSGDESLEAAAQLMSEHGLSHLVVVDAGGGYPVGVLSSLDVAAVYAES
jgi:CBS domain-containing protein